MNGSVIAWLLFAVVLSFPTLIEAFLDRRGETKEGKRKDFWWFVLSALLLSGAGWRFVNVSPLGSLALLLGWRLLIFDYLVTYLLIKNDVIVGHWWNYSGKTARWDKLISRIPPLVRLVLRVVLFALALLFFLYL